MMKNKSKSFRVFFVVFATTGTVILWFFFASSPYVIQDTSVSNHSNPGKGGKSWSDKMFVNSGMEVFIQNQSVYDESDIRKIINETESSTDSLEKSPFINRKYHLDEIKDYKTILWWNAPGWIIPWHKHTDMSLCHYRNCRVSYDQNILDKSAAVVFSLADRGMGNVPPVPKDKRNPEQAWVFFTLESPVHVKRSSSSFLSPNWHNTFNWSWNYRLDSDIFGPYGTLHLKNVIPERNYTDIFRKKTKQVAWLVSHCNSVGGRDDYVRVLQKYISVDIFGSCGMTPSSNITELISEQYKFYLGFENSLCKDYVTEKFFHYVSLDAVIVVRGKTNYSKVFPDKTFINTADFSSIKALGDFLIELSNNEEEYVKYLKSKDKFDVRERETAYADSACVLCDKLNNLEKNRKTYKNIGEWMGTCDRPTDLIET